MMGYRGRSDPSGRGLVGWERRAALADGSEITPTVHSHAVRACRGHPAALATSQGRAGGKFNCATLLIAPTRLAHHLYVRKSDAAIFPRYPPRLSRAPLDSMPLQCLESEPSFRPKTLIVVLSRFSVTLTPHLSQGCTPRHAYACHTLFG